VEPLDADGLSARDKALITNIVNQAAGSGGAGGSPTVVRVYIGDRELRDIVKYEVDDNNTVLARNLSSGRRRY
jgi:hypothetical protein